MNGTPCIICGGSDPRCHVGNDGVAACYGAPAAIPHDWLRHCVTPDGTGVIYIPRHEAPAKPLPTASSLVASDDVARARRLSSWGRLPDSIPATKDPELAGIELRPDAGGNGNAIQRDSIPASSLAMDAGIESAWLPVPMSKLTGGGPLPWVWHGYVAKGFVTVLVGLFKAGKSTLVGWLLRGMASGGNVAGVVRAARVLVVSEEGPALWAGRRDDLGIGDHVEFVIRPFKGKPGWATWERFIACVAGLVAKRTYDLVIIDTLAGFLPVRCENDAAEMLRALTPLHAITDAGAGLLLVHHPRKSDGGEGTASRGSGALPGFVDTIVELRRYAPNDREDRRRTLAGISRFDETPAEVVVELTADGYRTVGSKADAKHADRAATIREILPTGPPGILVDQILAAWPEGGVAKPGLRTLRSDLAGMADVMTTGDGAKGAPKRFYRSEK